MDFKQLGKAASFISFLLLKAQIITIFVAVLFNIFMRQTLTADFEGLHKNMNCTFPLSFQEI